MIDDEVRRIIEEAETKAREVLTEHLDDLHMVAKALLEYESLSGKEVDAILRGEAIDRSDETDSGQTDRRSSVPSTGRASTSGDNTGGLEPEPQPGG